MEYVSHAEIAGMLEILKGNVPIEKSVLCFDESYYLLLKTLSQHTMSRRCRNGLIHTLHFVLGLFSQRNIQTPEEGVS